MGTSARPFSHQIRERGGWEERSGVGRRQVEKQVGSDRIFELFRIFLGWVRNGLVRSGRQCLEGMTVPYRTVLYRTVPCRTVWAHDPWALYMGPWALGPWALYMGVSGPIIPYYSPAWLAMGPRAHVLWALWLALVQLTMRQGFGPGPCCFSAIVIFWQFLFCPVGNNSPPRK